MLRCLDKHRLQQGRLALITPENDLLERGRISLVPRLNGALECPAVSPQSRRPRFEWRAAAVSATNLGVAVITFNSKRWRMRVADVQVRAAAERAWKNPLISVSASIRQDYGMKPNVTGLFNPFGLVKSNHIRESFGSGLSRQSHLTQQHAVRCSEGLGGCVVAGLHQIGCDQGMFFDRSARTA